MTSTNGAGWDLENSLQLIVDGKPAVLWFTADEFKVSSLGEKAPAQDENLSVKLRTALQHVLYAEIVHNGDVCVSTLALKKNSHVLLRIRGPPKDGDRERASVWLGRLMYAAGCVVPGKRLKVLINPFGGKAQGRLIYENRAKPIFEACKCSLDVTVTTHQGHAEELAETLDITAYDAIVIVSGDGLAYEVFNGLAKRKDARTALKLPVVHVPAGSGNAFTVCLIGPKNHRDVALAVLNVVKGKPMKIDMASITQGATRKMTFLSQTLGLMADLDLDTEHLRWMGGTRFRIGFVRGLINPKACPVKIWLKIAESDKQKMADSFREHAASAKEGITNNGHAATEDAEGAEEDNGLPPLKYRDAGNEGWYEFPEKIMYLYGGLMPYVSHDFMQFPVAQANDGLLDLVLQTMTKHVRSDLLAAQDGIDVGKQYWMPSQHYYKVHAYRVIPLANKGNVSIDGERWPFQPFQVEVHAGLGTTLSMLGKWAGEF